MKIIAQNCSLVFRTFTTDPVLVLALHAYWDGISGVYNDADIEFNQKYMATPPANKYDISIFTNWGVSNGLSEAITIKTVAFDSNGDFLQRHDGVTINANGIFDVSTILSALPSGTAKIGFSISKNTDFLEGDQDLVTFIAKN